MLRPQPVHGQGSQTDQLGHVWPSVGGGHGVSQPTSQVGGWWFLKGKGRC